LLVFHSRFTAVDASFGVVIAASFVEATVVCGNVGLSSDWTFTARVLCCS
jgi:hypothetical protein